jgi:hypothetical protein
MARTLSDALIIAMIESATRLAGGRGPVSGISPATLAQSGGTAVEAKAEATPPAAPAPAPEVAEGAPARPDGAGAAADRDGRSAEQIAADFKTIYAQIEGLVRESAEQETARVGFGVR